MKTDKSVLKIKGWPIIARWKKNEWVKIAEPKFPDRASCVIMSHYGEHDWSGFRTYAECIEQKQNPHDDDFFVIVER